MHTSRWLQWKGHLTLGFHWFCIQAYAQHFKHGTQSAIFRITSYSDMRGWANWKLLAIGDLELISSALPLHLLDPSSKVTLNMINNVQISTLWNFLVNFIDWPYTYTVPCYHHGQSSCFYRTWETLMTPAWAQISLMGVLHDWQVEAALRSKTPST